MALVGNIIRWGFELWDRLESRPIPFRTFLVLFAGIVTLRNLMESFTSTGYIEQFATYSLHYPLAFVIAFLMLTVLLSACSGQPIVTVSRLMLYLWLLILLPPVVDMLHSSFQAGERQAIGWLSHEPGTFWRTFIDFYNPAVRLDGATAGIRMQSLLSCMLAAAYVYVKSRSILRTALTPFVIAFFSYSFFSLPTLFVAASSALSPDVSSTYKMVFYDDNFIRNFTQRAATSVAVYQLLLALVLFAIWLLLHDARRLRRLIASLEWGTIGVAFLLAGAGLVLGWWMFLPGMRPEELFTNHRDLPALVCLGVSLFGTALFRRALRDLFPREGGIDARGHQYDPGDLLVVSLLLTVPFAGVVSYPVLVWFAALLLLDTIFLVPPFQAAAVPVAHAAVRAGRALASVLIGFTLFTGNLAPSLIPGRIALAVLTAFFVCGLAGHSGTGRERSLKTTIPAAAGFLAAGILLPGVATLVGLAVAAVFFAASGYLPPRWRAVRLAAVPAALVISLVGLRPNLYDMTRGPRHFPDELEHSIMATFLKHDGLPGHAALEFEKAYRQGSEDPWVAYELGLRASHEGKPDEALAYYDRAIELDPGYAEALNNRMILLSEARRFDEAGETAVDLLALGEGGSRYFGNIATLFIKQGRAGDGLRLFLPSLGTAVSSDVRDAVARLVLAFAGEAGELDPDSLPAAAGETGDPVAELGVGVALLGAGRPEEALERFERVRGSAPFMTGIDYLTGSAYQEMGDHRRAIEAYRAFLEKQPENLEAGINLSACYLDSGDIARALSLLEDLASRHPDEPRVIVNLANALLDAGETERARHKLEELLESGRSIPLAHFNLAVILEREGDARGAFRHYREALEGGFLNPVLFTKVGSYLEAAGERSKARLMYRRALELDPGFGPARKGLERTGDDGTP